MIKKIFKWCLKIFVFCMVMLILFGGYCYIEYQEIINDTPLDIKVNQTRANPDFLELAEINETFISSLVASEDRRFFERRGFDFRAFVRSVLVNLKSGKLLQGGSTIPQQVAKLLYFDHDQDLKEKVLQVFVMYDLEARYSKDEVLELYINSIYFGSGYTGIKQASLGYFNTTPIDLDWPEASLLAGIIPASSIYDPTLNFNLAKQRQQAVLMSLVDVEILSQTEADVIFNLDLNLK